MYKTNVWKIWKYTRIKLKVQTKNCERKYLEDQKLLKYFIGIKNEIQDVYRSKNLFNPIFKDR
jgi:hypothetical protein